MTGTDNQIAWAEEIRLRVGAEFDRVVRVLRAVSAHQAAPRRAETQAIIAIVNDKRAEVMANEQAGYYIRVWQELDGQVRQMITQDPRYQVIQAGRKTRRQAPHSPPCHASGLA